MVIGLGDFCVAINKADLKWGWREMRWVIFLCIVFASFSLSGEEASLCSSFLVAEEPLPLSLNPDQSLSATKEKSQFLYIAGGITPLPTFSLGYRKLYSCFGSDLSFSVSAAPIFAANSGILPLPGVVYKQLFFTKKGWKGLEPGGFVFYWGLDVGIYPLGAFAVNGGGLIGWQFKRKARSDFFEIGVNPFLLSTASGLRVLPIGSLTYGFLF